MLCHAPAPLGSMVPSRSPYGVNTLIRRPTGVGCCAGGAAFGRSSSWVSRGAMPLIGCALSLALPPSLPAEGAIGSSSAVCACASEMCSSPARVSTWAPTAGSPARGGPACTPESRPRFCAPRRVCMIARGRLVRASTSRSLVFGCRGDGEFPCNGVVCCHVSRACTTPACDVGSVIRTRCTYPSPLF